MLLPIAKEVARKVSIYNTVLVMDSGNKFTCSEIVLCLMAEEIHIELREKELSHSNSTKVQFVSNQTIPKETVSNDSLPCNSVSKVNIICYKCRQKGHYGNRCTTIVSNQFKLNKGRPRGLGFVRRTNWLSSTGHLSITPHIFIAKISLNFKSNNSDYSWIFDTAATHHFCKDKSFLWNY